MRRDGCRQINNEHVGVYIPYSCLHCYYNTLCPAFFLLDAIRAEARTRAIESDLSLRGC